MFQRTPTLEDRIAQAQRQIAKAKENRSIREGGENRKKVERLIAKRPAGKPEIVDAKPAAVQEAAPLPERR